MIRLIEASGFRCLRDVRQHLGPFHVLVGPNASGKTTFLDVIAFLSDLLERGLAEAVSRRSRSFQDLVWRREGTRFELAVEAAIPAERQQQIKGTQHDTVRYELAVACTQAGAEISIEAETVLLKQAPDNPGRQQLLFPSQAELRPTVLLGSSSAHTRTVVNKVAGGNDSFYSEVYERSGKGWVPAFRLGSQRSALGNLPEDETRFPVATWLRSALTQGVQRLVLNSQLIRKASAPGQGSGFNPDGSNLPWVIADLEERSRERLDAWVEHLRTALPDLEGIRTVLRKDDYHRYLVLQYRGGLEVPSWMVSDGTLRLLALTLPAYLPELEGIYLIEEPENGIHPRAVDTMFQSLSSVYDAQILLATHSPVILSIAHPASVLCFAKTEAGETDIVAGDQHPALRDWRGETDLGALLASGVLG
jgi:predicted ATPase